MNDDTHTITAVTEQEVSVDITNEHLVEILIREASEILTGGMVDDAGCDWKTFKDHVMISHSQWYIGKSAEAASLVNAANTLRYGNVKYLPIVKWGIAKSPNGDELAVDYTYEYRSEAEQVVEKELNGFVAGLNRNGEII